MRSDRNISRRWGFAALIVGLVLIIGAFFVPDGGWWSTWESVLVNVGAALLIIWPVQFITHKIQLRFEERVDEQQQQSRQWHDEQQREIAALADRLDSVEKFDEVALEAQDAERRKTREVYTAFLHHDARGKEIWLAMHRAIRDRLISRTAGIYVKYAVGSTLLVKFTISEPHSNETARSVSLRLQNEIGEAIGTPVRLGWNDTIVSALKQLNDRARRSGDVSETRPSVILGALSEALLAADQYPETRPILQYFSPQWALTREMIVAPKEGWKIRHDALNRSELHYRQRSSHELDEGSFNAAVEASERVSQPTQDQINYDFQTGDEQ